MMVRLCIITPARPKQGDYQVHFLLNATCFIAEVEGKRRTLSSSRIYTYVVPTPYTYNTYTDAVCYGEGGSCGKKPSVWVGPFSRRECQLSIVTDRVDNLLIYACRRRRRSVYRGPPNSPAQPSTAAGEFSDSFLAAKC